jgi:NAD(P)H-dependent FMN reductase
MNAKFLVISTSLNPNSRSRLLAQAAYEQLKKDEVVELIDLVDYDLPICDGDSVYSDEAVTQLTDKIQQAQAILLALPVYNWSASASAKNLIELTGEGWKEKVVGFLCSAGGKHSYMAVMGIANSLMLDYRTLINPRFVYADSTAFSGNAIVDEEISKRIELLTTSTRNLVERVGAAV